MKICFAAPVFSLSLFVSLSPMVAVSQEPTAVKELTIEDIYQSGGILGRGPESIKWSPDGSKVAFVQRDDSGERGTLYCVDVSTGRRAVLVTSEKLSTLVPPTSAIKDERKKEAAHRYSIAAYHWAPDSQQLLFDSLGQLWLFSLDSGTAVQLTSGSDSSEDPKFSPDGKRLAYVRKHNLYVRSIADGRERALTKDGDENLLNGEVDWVYEEELFTRSNYFWSPDGKQIAFLQMNEKEVPRYPITDWIPTHATVEQEKYPQPGDPSPTVRLAIVNSDGGKTRWITAGGDKEGGLVLGNGSDVLVPRFGWVREGLLWALALDRLQTRVDLYFIDVNSGKSRVVMTESSDAWIDMHPEVDLKMLSSGDRYLWTSWRDGHNHIYLYQFDKQNPLGADAKMMAQLTKGDWEVESIDGVDEQRGVVYFSANEGDWRQENVFSVGLDGQGFRRVSKGNGTHTADFEPKDAKYYVDRYSAVMTPPAVSLCAVNGACKAFWKPHSVEGYSLLAPKFVDFKAADDTTLLGQILLPVSGPMVAGGKVPLIVNPYGGPGVQSVRDAWIGGDLFDQVLTRQGFAVLHVDNRGMANRGKAFAIPIKHNLGEVELADQIAAVKQALEKYPQLDASRIGFWGWSYGGYFTLYAMEHSDMFKAGVSVAPVTDWRNYDSIYTERYMGLPKDNEEGYKKSSPVNFAANLHGKLLEIHGTGDDNVHVQNTMQMANELINSGKQFQLMLYPRKTHGISGAAASTHLFHMINDFFLEALAPGK
ncbi:MAG: DPP IV N-terminal domain-containing protein [Acidobacteriota bacterium]|nr:DPP IV N-terminal domain-containing protein [Acidobacteriota bacterium]